MNSLRAAQTTNSQTIESGSWKLSTLNSDGVCRGRSILGLPRKNPPDRLHICARLAAKRSAVEALGGGGLIVAEANFQPAEALKN